MITINNICIGCGVCVDICPVTALRLAQKNVIVDKNICIDCGICVKKCPFGAIETNININGAIIKDIRFQVTKGCNFNCVYCFSDAKHSLKNELSLDEAKAMTDELISCGLKTMTLTGGEPLVRKDFTIDLLTYLRKKKIYSKLFTNGSLLDEKTIAKLSGITDEVQISVHEYNSVDWQKIGSLFKQLKAKGIRGILRITLTVHNYKEIKKIIKFAEGNKIDCLRVRPFVAQGRGLRNKRSLMNKDAYSKSVGYLASIRRNKDYPIQLLTPSFAFLYDKEIKPNLTKKIFLGLTSCKCASDLGAILPDGEVRACAYFPQDLGNIRTQAFKDIWSENNKIKKRLKVEHLDKKCMNCSYIAICGGGCRANAYVNAGSLTAPDPNCPKAQKI